MSAGTRLSDEDASRLDTLQALLDLLSEFDTPGGLRKRTVQTLALHGLALVDIVIANNGTNS